MSFSTFDAAPLSPHLGAEITGIDLTKRLDSVQIAELNNALSLYQVIFFRDQELDHSALKAFGECFGSLVVHPNAPSPEGHPEITPIHADANSNRIVGEHWHSDVSCASEPPLGSVLYLHTVPPLGGDTFFASQYAAYDALSDRMKTHIDGLTAFHDGAATYRASTRKRGLSDAGKVYPSWSHPVVRTHPTTKRKALFVNREFTKRINELSEEESDALLRYLIEHSTKPEFQLRFRWTPNCTAFWDNRCLQHLAIWDYFPNTRSGYRVTIEGDRPH